MAIKVNKDSKLIKVLASQARYQTVAQDQADEAEQIIAELSQDMSPENRHQLRLSVTPLTICSRVLWTS